MGYPCPLCGRTERSPIRSVPGYSRCPCGLVCNDMENPPEDYQGHYFTAEAPGEGHRDFESEAARRYDERRFGEELDRLGPPLPGGRLLDVGSATGSYLALAAKRGWQAVGVEISDDARTMAESRGVDSRPSLAEVEELAPFAVVTLHHVLEHLADPVETLRTVGALMAPGGRLVIEVPNWRSMERRAMGSQWMDLRPNQHRWHWDPATLRGVVEAAGMEIGMIRALGEPIPSPASVLRSLGVPERWLDAWRARRWRAKAVSPPTPEPAGAHRSSQPVTIAAAVIDAVESRTLLGKRLVVEAHHRGA